jgi:hypothetical protein
MAITWKTAETNEGGTEIEFSDGTYKVYIRMSEKFESLKTSGTLEFEDVDKYLAIHQDHIRAMFTDQTGDDFKDEGVFLL